jgi:hypothetical protein
VAPLSLLNNNNTKFVSVYVDTTQRGGANGSVSLDEKT